MRKTVFTFPVGEVRMTTNAARNLDHEDMLVAFQRHTERDWRGCCKEDAEANERALSEGGRLLSVHKDRNEIKFWIITESDRSATTTCYRKIINRMAPSQLDRFGGPVRPNRRLPLVDALLLGSATRRSTKAQGSRQGEPVTPLAHALDSAFPALTSLRSKSSRRRRSPSLGFATRRSGAGATRARRNLSRLALACPCASSALTPPRF
jgi:hypothetical protein